jgi:hypothetical protein
MRPLFPAPNPGLLNSGPGGSSRGKTGTAREPKVFSVHWRFDRFFVILYKRKKLENQTMREGVSKLILKAAFSQERAKTFT